MLLGPNAETLTAVTANKAASFSLPHSRPPFKPIVGILGELVQAFPERTAQLLAYSLIVGLLLTDL